MVGGISTLFLASVCPVEHDSGSSFEIYMVYHVKEGSINLYLIETFKIKNGCGIFNKPFQHESTWSYNLFQYTDLYNNTMSIYFIMLTQ